MVDVSAQYERMYTYAKGNSDSNSPANNRASDQHRVQYYCTAYEEGAMAFNQYVLILVVDKCEEERRSNRNPHDPYIIH